MLEAEKLLIKYKYFQNLWNAIVDEFRQHKHPQRLSSAWAEIVYEMQLKTESLSTFLPKHLSALMQIIFLLETSLKCC